MKKIVSMVLALVLLVGGAATAAELSVSRDLQRYTTVRGTVEGFYGELEFWDGSYYANDSSSWGGLRGLNFGIKAQTEGPFYGLAQLNFQNTWDKEDKEPTGNYYYEGFELGGGASFNALWDVNIGAEATLANPDIVSIDELEPNLALFASVDFELFPDPTV